MHTTWRHKAASVALVLLLAAVPTFAGGAPEGTAPAGSTGTAVIGPGPLTADGRYATVGDYESATGNRIISFNEAPILASMVSSGELPAVEDRLPDEPLVIFPLEQNGPYGGTLTVTQNFPDFWGPQSYMNLEELLAFDWDDPSNVLPNIVKGWDLSADGRSLTLFLRPGHRWSDGDPFDADDFLFWYEDILQNEDLTPSISRMWKPGDELMGMQKVDDQTVRFSFAVAFPGMVYALGDRPSRGIHSRGPFDVSHHLKQFHIDYNTDADSLAKEEGFEAWSQLFRQKRTYNDDIQELGLPNLAPWIPEVTAVDHTVLVRNPYYFKIDPAGNQLPYIDRVRGNLAGNFEIVAAKVLAGEPDFGSGPFGGGVNLDKLPVLVKNADANNYRVSIQPGAFAWTALEVVLNLNHTTEDPVIRSLFNDLRFKQALSHGINRDEINQFVFLGVAEPSAATVSPTSPYYEERFANAFIEYDPDLAKQLLDEVGLATDSDGYRLRPDGERLNLIIETASFVEAHAQAAELIVDQWDQIGIKATAHTTAGGEMWQIYDRNIAHISIWRLGAAFFPRTLMEPPFWGVIQFQGRLWQQWIYSDGAEGEEPPSEMLEAVNLWREIPFTLDRGEVIRKGKRALELLSENLWIIGVVTSPPEVKYARNTLKNVNLDKLPDVFYGLAGAFQWALDE